MSADVRAFWVVAPGRGEIRSETLTPPAGAVVVRALYSGISRGTEALVFQGRVPPTEYRRMRAPFQAGDFPSPVKYGYASVGLVERGPADLLNRNVFVLHPHQTRYGVPAESVHVVPDDVPPERAVLTRQPRDGDQRCVGRAAASRGSRRGHWRRGRRLSDSVARRAHTRV
jgi:hypothetical protein